MARIRGASGWEIVPLTRWEASGGDEWIPATVPGTAASALRDAGQWQPGDLRDFDAESWRWRTVIDVPADGRSVLRCDGVATLAEVLVDGEVVARSESMFRALQVDVPPGRHDVELRCRALAPHLAQKRPRGRWRTRLVAQSQLRWVRTTFLGRMPGWAPAPAPLGPWREVRLETRRGVDLDRVDLAVTLDDDDGIVRGTWRGGQGRLIVGDLSAEGDSEATVRLPDVPRWWPHTHGARPRFPVSLVLDGITLDLGKVGFRTLAVDRRDDGFRLVVNDVPVFARGACWAPVDVASLGGDVAAAVAQARDAGLNMLRVGGTMAYEDDAFHEACDALGVLVWQDAMLANLDYPAELAAEIAAEVDEQLDRVQGPSLVVVCGGSEIAQQAAMLGLPRETWSGPLFDERLPAVVAARRPDVAYVPHTPWGGPLPFVVDHGVGHYYGVGAYRRPLEDARRADVRFATECLAFANVPVEETCRAVPDWKARVPRDVGADWDFEDVRDHYLALLHGVDPAALRASDPARYLALSREVTGEVMARVFAEWRRPASRCGGGLVWLLRDLLPGAGWGLIDAFGRPKPALALLSQGLTPLFFTDEGVNGLALHVVNERAEAMRGTLEVDLLRGDLRVDGGTRELTVAPRGGESLSVDAVLGHFADASYAYRFGPRGHDRVRARFAGHEAQFTLP